MADPMIQCQFVACSLSAPPLSIKSSTSAAGSSSLAPSASFLRTRLSNAIPCMSNDGESSRWAGALRAQGEVQDQPVVESTEDKVGWWEKNLGVPIRDLHSAQELSEAISAADGKLVIVEFFASWCGSCRALYPKLCKLAVEHPDMVFVKINFDENKALCKSLNVKVLPYFHFYRYTSTQLESFSCSVTKLQKLKDAIAKYEAGGQPASLQDDAASRNE